MGQYTDSVVSFFNSLHKNSMHLVTKFYSDDATFFDPVVTIKSASEIEKYYQGLYTNVEEIQFEFSEIIEADNWVAAPWVMHLKTSKLNAGKLISVPGISHIKFDLNSGKAVYHRDYFDMGAFIYEYVPVLGMAVRFIKKKLH